jgi:O-antigen/teichoic acid export membrane protein
MSASDAMSEAEGTELREQPVTSRLAAGWSRMVSLRGLTPNSIALMSSTAGTSLLGIAFWATAARLYSAAQVGRASAELSAMALIAQLASINLGTAFVRYLPTAGRRARPVVLVGYTACLVLGVAGSVVFLATGFGAGIVPGSLALRLAFGVTVCLWTLFIVQDGVLTALRKAAWVPVENIAFGAAKLALLPVFCVVAASEGVFFAWTTPVVLVVTVVNSLLFRRVLALSDDVQARSIMTALGRPSRLLSFASAEYLTGLVSVSTTYLLPLVIIRSLGSTANAYFYIPWLGSVIFTNLLSNIAVSLIVEISHDGRAGHSLLRKSVRLMALITGPSTVLAVVVGSPILALLSHNYTNGAALLRLLGLSFPFHAVIIFFTAILWMERKIWTILGYQFLQAAVLVGLTYLFLGRHGIEAPGLASLIAYGGGALLSVPFLVRGCRRILVDEVAG